MGKAGTSSVDKAEAGMLGLKAGTGAVVLDC